MTIPAIAMAAKAMAPVRRSKIAAESPPLSGHISKAKCGNTRTLNLNNPILNSAVLVPRLT